MDKKRKQTQSEEAKERRARESGSEEEEDEKNQHGRWMDFLTLKFLHYSRVKFNMNEYLLSVPFSVSQSVSRSLAPPFSTHRVHFLILLYKSLFAFDGASAGSRTHIGLCLSAIH